jgi:hypothetical protein
LFCCSSAVCRFLVVSVVCRLPVVLSEVFIV